MLIVTCCTDVCIRIPIDWRVCAQQHRYDRRGMSNTFLVAELHLQNLFQITLRGRVGPVGGIKEKVLGAHRAGVTKVILPWANRKDVDHDVPPEVRSIMQFSFVRTVEEALEAAFGKGTLGWRPNNVLLESRL